MDLEQGKARKKLREEQRMFQKDFKLQNFPLPLANERSEEFEELHIHFQASSNPIHLDIEVN